MSKSPPVRQRGRWAPGADVLACAARAVSRIAEGGRSAEDALAPFDTHAERAAIRAITLGTVRWYLRLKCGLDALLERPEGLARELLALLVAGAHQIEYSRNPPHSTVDAAVDAARILKQDRAAGLVNAVLRRFAREKGALLAKADSDIATRTAHPRWLVERLREAWPEHLTALLDANNAHPPMVLRVDTTRTSVPDYVAELAAADIAAHPIAWAPSAVELEKPVPVGSLPGFNEGRVSVQDAGAQLAAPLLACAPGMRVLDACAAPGGKTSHLLELTPDIDLLAVDIDERRIRRVQENLDRVRRKARLVVADVRTADAFWDGRPFDRILVDAPCSSTGVIRRHPDIKLLRRPTDIAALAAAQLEILRATFAMLAPGGRLIYCTCSVVPEENEGVLADFLRRERRARVVPATLAAEVPGALNRSLGVQLLPGTEAGTDGFHYACVEKATDGT
ncbi:MAG TPA: 16S rRNA (cytosine(967)-C(5))-methyltransferase RsmB [Steroidobacteraceae bacterium]|nr:16S rRNA (cytosine(967)-C(5))-methyltransferase RsmB [Steroidobacteraceae bacterium]